MEMRFCPLFSGSSGNALYVGYGDTHILIDAGMSGAKIRAELARFGVMPNQLSGILITHEHADHISGVGVLSRRNDLPVYANEPTWAAMRAKLGSVSEKNQRVFATGEDFLIGQVDVMPFATQHDAAESVGFVLSAGDAKLAIVTDVGAVRKSWLKEVEDADLVLLESNYDEDMLRAGRYPYDLKRRIMSTHGHLSNDDAGDAAVQLVQGGVRCIVLGHLSAENNFPELAYESVCAKLREAGLEPGKDAQISIAGRDGSNSMYVIGEKSALMEVI